MSRPVAHTGLHEYKYDVCGPHYVVVSLGMVVGSQQKMGAPWLLAARPVSATAFARCGLRSRASRAVRLVESLGTLISIYGSLSVDFVDIRNLASIAPFGSSPEVASAPRLMLMPSHRAGVPTRYPGAASWCVKAPLPLFYYSS